MRTKTYIVVCATAALGLSLTSPRTASAFPAAAGADKVYSQTVSGNASIPVRFGRVGGWGGHVGGWGGRGFGYGRGIGWGRGWGGVGLGRGFGWGGRGWGWRGGYGGWGGGWGWPLGLGVGLAAATPYYGGYYPGYLRRRLQLRLVRLKNPPAGGTLPAGVLAEPP